MSAETRSTHSKYAGLLPIEPQDHFLCPIDLKSELINLKPQQPIDLKPEDVLFPNWEPSARNGRRILARFPIALCTGVAAAWLWQSYGDAAREMITNSYRLFAPRPALTAQNPRPPDVTALAAPAAPLAEKFNTMLSDLDAVGQNKIATAITGRQEQTTRDPDQAITSIEQAPVAKATSGVTVESQGDAAALQPAARLTDVKPPETLLEKGKPLTVRPRGSDRRRERVARKEMVGTRENGLAAPLAPRPQGWSFGLP
jgi:hypothetical protein